MQKPLFAKLIAISFISFIILIALWLIENQISARQQRQASVIANIAESAAEAQTLIGPVLMIRYQQPSKASDKDANGESSPGPLRTRMLALPAKQLITQGTAQVETRQRGIFHGQLYHLSLNLKGLAELPDRLTDAQGRAMLNPRAYLVLSVSDLRGVDNAPSITVNGKLIPLQTSDNNTCIDSCMAGQHLAADLGPIDENTPRKLEFSLPLNLTGTQSLAIAPVADSNTIELQSTWPHPSFGGRFLPRQRDVTAGGFGASWQISHLSRKFDAAMQANRSPNDKEYLQVSLMEPVNVYLLAERAVKYGILFVVLTFGAFFVTEALSRSPIHPIQYLLVGLALAIFFLLLIALSEHLSFAWSYLVSALACIGLIATYMSGVLRSKAHGIAFGAGLTGLYGLLFGIIHSEDNALLIGSVLLFVALSCVMLGTRRLNWYGLSNEEAA